MGSGEEGVVDWERARVERRRLRAQCFHAIIVRFVERNGASMGCGGLEATLCSQFYGARLQTFRPISATANPTTLTLTITSDSAFFQLQLLHIFLTTGTPYSDEYKPTRWISSKPSTNPAPAAA